MNRVWKVCAIVVLVLVSLPLVSFAKTKGGTQYAIHTNNTSHGTLLISSDERSGVLSFPSEKVREEIRIMRISERRIKGSREITFIRPGKVIQVYTGWISKDSKVIAGYLVNLNDKVKTTERFPFYALRK